MISARLGDLAQSLQLRRANTDLKSQLDRLSTELASGRTADPLTRLGGDVDALSGLETALRMNGAWRDSRNEAALFAGAQQQALERMQDLAMPLGPSLLEAAASNGGARLASTLSDTASRFSAFVSAINGTFAGRSLFSGAATQTPALAPAETILAELDAAVSGAATAADVIAAAEDFFLTPGGGFETLIYQGSDDALAPMPLDGSATVTLGLTAADPALRQSVMHLAIGALMHDGLMAGNSVERKALIGELGNGMLQSGSDIVTLRAGVGTAEARIEEAQARGAAQTASLEMALAELTGVDPFETATRLEQARLQLETVYTLTARLSGMSLAQVLR